jgi:hypothetical protein
MINQETCRYKLESRKGVENTANVDQVRSSESVDFKDIPLAERVSESKLKGWISSPSRVKNFHLSTSSRV